MGIILNIDASDEFLYISISKDGDILADKLDAMQKNHAAALQINVQEILDKCNLKFTDLNAVAVMNGPGSYTGLRVGLAAAKGYCFGLDIPLICISNLEAIAFEFYKNNVNFLEPIQTIISPMKNELILATYNKNFEVLKEPIHIKDNYNINLDCLCIGNVNLETLEYFKINKYEKVVADKKCISKISNQYFIRNIHFSLPNAYPFYVKEIFVN